MITLRFRSLLALSALASSALSAPIAGLAPHERPAGAPRVAATLVNDAPGSPFLHGVTPPVPPSLNFLRDQGNWYSPFDQPGMPGRYDIRGWYANPPTAGKH